MHFVSQSHYIYLRFYYIFLGKGFGCHAKEGNPFGPFWDTFNIDFAGSEFYSPLHYDTYYNPNMAIEWKEKYPPNKWPVIAFTGTHLSFLKPLTMKIYFRCPSHISSSG